MNHFPPLLFVILTFSSGNSIHAAPIRWSPDDTLGSAAVPPREGTQGTVQNDWTAAETGELGTSSSFELLDLNLGHLYQVRIQPAADPGLGHAASPQRFGDGEVTENFSVYLPMGNPGKVTGEFVADAVFQRLTINAHPDFEQVGTAIGALHLRDLGPVEDADHDGIADLLEDAHPLLDKFDPADAGFDSDGDGLTNLEEIEKGTDLNRVDTDGDGLTDGDEVYGLSNPFLDGAHVGAPGAPTDPRQSDSDRDGLTDWEEIRGEKNRSYQHAPTDPNSSDTDGDDFTDRSETLLHADPTDPFSQPPKGLQAGGADRSGSPKHDQLLFSQSEPQPFKKCCKTSVVPGDSLRMRGW